MDAGAPSVMVKDALLSIYCSLQYCSCSTVILQYEEAATVDVPPHTSSITAALNAALDATQQMLPHT
jgi:hypothetical protein